MAHFKYLILKRPFFSFLLINLWMVFKSNRKNMFPMYLNYFVLNAEACFWHYVRFFLGNSGSFCLFLSLIWDVCTFVLNFMDIICSLSLFNVYFLAFFVLWNVTVVFILVLFAKRTMKNHQMIVARLLK